MPEKIDRRDAAFMNGRIESHPVELEEIWLDALVTAIEAGGGQEVLLGACKNPAQVIPRSSAEKKELDDKKSGLEMRLDMVFKWLQTKRDIGFTKDFEDNVEEKEEIVREQSVAMMEYIEEMEQNLLDVGDEISTLQKKYKNFKSSLRPLF